MTEVNIGKIFVEAYGHRWKNKASQKYEEGKCCWGNCDNDHSGTYMGFPFCQKHWDWVEKRLEEIYDSEQRKAPKDTVVVQGRNEHDRDKSSHRRRDLHLFGPE